MTYNALKYLGRTLASSTEATAGTDAKKVITPLTMQAKFTANKSATETLTNKTIDVDSNTISNVNADELQAVTEPSAGDASDSVYGVPSTIRVYISNQNAAVNVFNSNAPFKFVVLDAWSTNASADGGTWKLDNGTNDICAAVTVAASDTDIDRIADLDDAYATIASGGSLRVVPDAGGALDCYININILKLS